jgi:hypothetical protein
MTLPSKESDNKRTVCATNAQLAPPDYFVAMRPKRAPISRRVNLGLYVEDGQLNFPTYDAFAVNSLHWRQRLTLGVKLILGRL